jgi:hypothetical protein
MRNKEIENSVSNVRKTKSELILKIFVQNVLEKINQTMTLIKNRMNVVKNVGLLVDLMKKELVIKSLTK